MELDQNSDSDFLDHGYDIVSPYTIPDQKDTVYFPKEETGQGLPFGCQWVGDALSGIEPDDSTLSIPEESVCTDESEGVSLVEVLKPVSNLEEKMEENVQVEGLQNTNTKVFKHTRKGLKISNIDVYEKMESFRIPTFYNLKAFHDDESDQTFEYNESLEPNVGGLIEENERLATPVLNSFCNLTESDGKDSPYVDFDIVSSYAIPDQVDAMYFPEEKTGQGLPFSCQWMGDALSEFDTMTQSLEQDSIATGAYQEGGIKLDDSTLSIQEENVSTGESEGWNLVEVLKPVSNLEEKMEENVQVERLRNTNVKVLEHARKGFKILKIDECEETEKFLSPTFSNQKAICGDESDDQTIECNELLEPNFVYSTIEEKQNYATPVLDSFYNFTESDNVSSYAIPDRVDTMYFPEEETGQGLPFSCQWMGDALSEFDPMTQSLEQDSIATAAYQEGGIKLDDSTLSIPEEIVCTSESEGGSLVEVLKPVSNLEEKVEENVQVEGLQNTNVKVLEHTRKGFKKWKIDEYEKTENFRIPTFYNLNAIRDDESDQTFEYSESLEPNFVDTNEEKQNHGTPVLNSFHNLTESDGKGSPDVDFEEASNTGDKSQKGKVPVEELSLEVVENTTTVLEGDVVGLKLLDSVDNTCTEKLGYRGDLKKREKAGEDGAGEPASKETSKKKKCKKKKAQKSSPAWKKTNNRSDTMNAHPIPSNSYASYVKSASEKSYTKGIKPVIDPPFAKDVRPANENFNARGVKPSSEHLFTKGFHPASENSYARGFKPASEQSYCKVLYPASENLYGRGLRPTSEHSLSKHVHQTCETSPTNVFRPACETSFAKGCGPASENLRVKDAHQTTGNWFAKDNEHASVNVSRERKVSFSDILVAKRQDRASYQNTLRETKHMSIPYCSSPTPILMSRLSGSDIPKPCDGFGTSGPVPTADPSGTRQVAVVEPRPKEMEMFSKQIPGPQTAGDFLEMILTPNNMFEERSAGRKKGPDHEKHTNGSLSERGTNFQRGGLKEWLRKGRGQCSREGSAERGFKGSCRQWTQNAAEQHPDYNRGSTGPEESEKLKTPMKLKRVNWVGKEDVGRFFVSGLTTVDTTGNGESSCNSKLNFLTFDELVLLDGLETAVVSITDSIDTVVAKGFVARFPGSCSLHLLVNEVDRIYPEYIIVCCSCPKLIIAHEVEAVKSCPTCRFVRLGTYPEMKIKCQFMLLRSARMLRFVLISSSLSICEWEKRLQFGWFHDFPVVHETNSDCYVSSDQQHSPFWNDLNEFLTSMKISDLDLFSGVDFSNVSPAVRLIHTKPGVSCANDPPKYGAPQLQKIIKNLVWKSPKKRQSLYKTERLGQRCSSILNEVFQNALSGDSQTSVNNVKVVYPSLRWVNKCVANSESPERLELLSTVKDIHSVGDLPWNFLYDLPETKDFVQNYNVLEQYEHLEWGGKTRKYGWFLTGSQALDTESWGDDYPVYHKVMYKHFQLSVGLFPYLRRNEKSKEVEICAVDLCEVPLPFDPVAVDHYRHDDMPRLVLGSGQNVFCHCLGVFTRVKSSYGFIKQSPLLKGLLEPVPEPQPGQFRHDVFLHVSCMPQLELPPEGSVIEFFFLNQPPTNSKDFIKVCKIFTSIEEARHHFLSAMGIAIDEEMLHKEMVQAKAVELGIELIDDVKQMEDAIEDHYNALFSSRHRRFTYFPTQQQVDAISIEPVKILSDTDWVRDYYKNRRNRGSLPQDVGGCRPRVLLANFQAMKYRFVKGLREVEEENQKLEEENKRYIRKCKV